MKKIILFAATLLLTLGIQAATVNWTSAGMKDYAGNAYQFFVIGQNGASIDAVTAALNAGNSTSSMAFGSGNVGTTGMGSSTATQTLDAGTYTSFMVLFDNADASKATSYVVISGIGTQTQTFTPAAASVRFVAGNVSSIVGESSNWASIGGTTPTPPSGDIPEPTSGLLLVIGGALLALRRKQK